MNKKFSTLAVAAMLASAFTAYAGPGDVVTKLAEGNNGKQYQLRTTTNVGTSTTGSYLALDEKDGKLILVENPNEWTNADGDVVSILGKSLWCVDVTLENQGKNPIFDFINKGEGSVLDVTVGGWNSWGSTLDGSTYTGVKISTQDTRVGGEVSGWEFTPVLGSNSVPMFGLSGDADSQLNSVTAYSLNSYISSTHVATLVWDDTNDEIRVAVVAADDLSTIASKQIKFFLQEAYPVDLTADQFNTILNTQKASETVKMTFVKDYNNTEIINPFSTNEFNAVDAESNVNCSLSGCDLDGEHNFVYLYKTEADATKNYLHVDTAYANGYGTKFLTFAFESKFGADRDSEDPADETVIPDQYKFRLNYCPTDDSLSIQVKKVVYKLKDDARAWSNLGTTTAYGNMGVPTAGADYTIAEWTDDAIAHPSGLTNHITNWVKLQDLELSTESRIVTIGDAPINTHISFGYGDCASVASEYTSVADGVYYIKNAKGQYLTYPIYVGQTGEPQFVTVNADEQDVAHMPAFQWVVLKNYMDAGAPTSPVKIANREFATASAPYFESNAQLKKAAGATYMYVQGNKLGAVAVDSLEFVAVPQESIKDPYLGYKKLTKEELQVNKYTFNYWHPYATDKYIALAEGDSIFTVWDEISAFNIDTVAYNPVKYTGNINRSVVASTTTGTDEIVDQSTVDIAYGFNPANAKLNNKERIPGLAQLVRTAYQVSLNGTEWKVNQNDQFNTGKNSWAYGQSEDKGVQSIDKYVVFFKENMHVNGQHYYAILKANNDKQLVGIDENGGIVKADAATASYNRELDKYTDPDGDGIFTNTVYVVDEFKAGVSDYDGSATLKNQPIVETRTSSFAINPDDTPLYRRFNSTLEGIAGDGADTLRFYEKYRNEYLMVEANPSFMVAGIDFLGINAQDKADGGLAFIVDTAWVNRGAGNIKPQYLISIDRHDFAGTPGVPCVYEHNHYDNEGNQVDAAHCSHATQAIPGFARGKYLINFHNFANNDEMVGSDDYKWAEYDRAGFKEAIVYNDTLYILRDEFKNLPNEEIDLAKLASVEVEALKAWTREGGNHTAANFPTYKYVLTGDNHKYVTWSMRFFDRSVAANEVEADRAFLFESMKSLIGANSDGKYNANDNHYVKGGTSNVHNGIYEWGKAEGDVAPTQAAWLKMQNGCLVLSDENSKFNEVTTGSDDALIFNVEHVDGDKLATDNEAINVEGVKVIAGDGQVTIMGAAGKNVTITTVLGKTVVAKAIASDNETIAVPTTGIVAVAVEGEEAIMTIVK